MSDCKTLHESVLKDIVDLLTNTANSDTLPSFFSDKSYKSVAAATEKLTLIFPVFVSNDIGIENAVMVSRAIERKAVTMMQMLFTAMNISDARNAVDYVSRFHGNLDTRQFTIDDFIEGIDDYVASQPSLECKMTPFDAQKATKLLQESVKSISYVLPDDVNDHSLNEYAVKHFNGDIIITEKGINAKDFGYSGSLGGGNNKAASNYVGYTGNSGKSSNSSKKSYSTSSNSASKDFDFVDDSLKSRRFGRGLDQYGKLAKANKDAIDFERNRVFTTDIKKANELVPTMMVINFVNSELGVASNAVIGIKAKLYPIDSRDIINRIMLKNKDNQGFLNFLRATTREISFWKDFVLAVDKAKIDAIGSRRGSSSKIWKVLERRAFLGRFKRIVGAANDSAAISTLVISKNDVEILKKEYNINVEKPGVIRPIMESYSLMCFCIVDETMEAVKFIFDTGDDNYETLSFTHLEREASDGSYKKIVNLMSKISR